MKGWPSVKAGEILTFRTGKLDSNAAEINGKFPFFTCAQETFRINSYAFDTECVLLAGNNASGIFALKYFSGKFNAYQRTYVIEPRANKQLSVKYIFESFKLFLKSFEQTATGATTKFLTMGILNNLWISVPPLPIQHKIAAVLSAYDDLIENNNRRIALLEKMGEELYREWFVRMRFPGHESTKIVKGVPEGWELKNCHTILDIMGGGTPRTEVSNYWDGDIPFFTPKDSHDGYFVFETEKWLTEPGLQNCNSPLYPKGTIFITARGTVGNIVIAGRSMAMNQSCYALRPKKDSAFLFHFLALKNAVAVIRGTANSGVFDNIITDSFKQFGYLIPSISLLQSFEELAKPIFSRIEALLKASSVIGISRDRLLTRLMSGKIDLEALDIAFPPSMQEAA